MEAFIGLLGGVCVIMLALFFALVPIDEPTKEEN